MKKVSPMNTQSPIYLNNYNALNHNKNLPTDRNSRNDNWDQSRLFRFQEYRRSMGDLERMLSTGLPIQMAKQEQTFDSSDSWTTTKSKLSFENVHLFDGSRSTLFNNSLFEISKTERLKKLNGMASHSNVNRLNVGINIE